MLTDAQKVLSYTNRKISQINSILSTKASATDISDKAEKANVLELNNTTPFTPNADYEPATKKYVDDNGITLLDVYPVGAIYISVDPTSPATLFGGTWAAFGAGKVLVGIDSGDTSFDTVEETGGAKTHTLTTAEMPSHNHIIPDVRSATTGIESSAIARSVDTTSTRSTDIRTENTGSGNAHNNLQPYLVVYMFKRTA